MTLWGTIAEAQAKKQGQIRIVEEGKEVQIKLSQNGWYEDFVSVS